MPSTHWRHFRNKARWMHFVFIDNSTTIDSYNQGAYSCRLLDITKITLGLLYVQCCCHCGTYSALPLWYVQCCCHCGTYSAVAIVVRTVLLPSWCVVAVRLLSVSSIVIYKQEPIGLGNLRIKWPLFLSLRPQRWCIQCEKTRLILTPMSWLSMIRSHGY